MTLENILNKGIEKFQSAKKTAKNALLLFTLGAGLACFTGCDKLQHPLAPQIQGAVQQTAGYHFCGQPLQIVYTPLQTPCTDVSYRLYMPGAGQWSESQLLQQDSNGKYIVTLNSNNPGAGLIQFTANGKEGTAQEFDYYMNESQSDQALSEAITEIGVIPVGSALEDAITDKWANQDSLGYNSDAVVAVKNTSKRSASNPRALYYIDVQGSELDTLNFTKKNALNANGEGYIHISPVQSKDEIKQQINSEKGLSWPQVATLSTGYAVSTKAGDIFNGENTDFTITSTGANAAEISVKTPSGSYGAYESLSKSGSNFTKNLTTSEYGDYNAKFRLSLDRTVMNEVIDVADEATSRVYMNEGDGDAALEQAVQEIGVNSNPDPLQIPDNDIRNYWMNTDGAGTGNIEDTVLLIKKDPPIRGPPTYSGYYGVNVKGSNSDTYNPAVKTAYNTNLSGYMFIDPVQNKDEIKNRLLQEKSAGWPEITP